MSYAQLAEAFDAARQRPVTQAPPPATRSLATGLDQHIAWQETGTGPQHALALPALAAVVRLIASAIDQLDLTTTAGPLPRSMRQPRYYEAHLDQGDLLQHVVTDMAVRGRAFLLATWKDTKTEPGWKLEAVHHDSVGVQSSTFGVVDLRFTFNGEPVRRLPYSGEGPGPYLIHIPYLVTSASPAGTTPIREAQQSIDGYLAVERQAASLLDGGGGYNGGILTTEQMIDWDTAEQMQERWAANRRTGKIPVLGSGLAYEGAGVVTPRDATWIESREANALACMALFGVPPDMLGMTMAGGGSSLSYSNSADNLRRFRINCLAAFTSQIEDALSPLLRDPTGTRRVAFDFTEWEGAAASDTSLGQQEAVQKVYLGVTNGVISAEEARQMINDAGGNLDPGRVPEMGGPPDEAPDTDPA